MARNPENLDAARLGDDAEAILAGRDALKKKMKVEDLEVPEDESAKGGLDAPKACLLMPLNPPQMCLSPAISPQVCLQPTIK